MKVLVLTSTYPRWTGDSEPGFVHELNKRLASNHEIITLAPSFQGSKSEEVMDGVTVIRYRYFLKSLETLCYQGGILPNLKKRKWKVILIPFLLMAMAITALRLHRDHKFDLVHSHWIVPQGIVWAVISTLFQLKTPSIITSHGGDLFSLRKAIFGRLKTFAIEKHNSICVVSNAMKSEAENLGVDPKKINVMPMGVDLTKTFVTPSENNERQGIIFIGRLVSKKGVNYLLEAYMIILEANPHITLTIIGEGPEKAALMDLSKKLNIFNKVAFLGAKNQLHIRNQLQKSKYAVFPSITSDSGDKEGLGLTIIEALGCGCITITTQQEAFNDIKAADNNLVCVKEKSSQDIANQIIRLEKDNISHINLGDKKQLAEAFDWNQIASKYNEMYRMISKA